MKQPGTQAKTSVANAPLYEYEQPPLRDGSFDIRARTISNTPEVSWETDDSVMHVVLAHGAWGGPITMAPLMRRFVQAAHAKGQLATATLYRDPWFGFGNYAADHRTGRFEKVVMATARRMEAPVHLVAHSWAGEGGAEVAMRAKREERAASFIGYTLSNHFAEGSMGFGSFLAGACRELVRGDAVAGPRSLLTIGAVGLSALTHGLGDVRAAIAECAGALNCRMTDQLVLTQDILPTGVLLAGRDAIFGDGSSARQHLRYAGFAGAIGIMEDATHLSSVTNYHHGEELYALAYATIHPELPGSATYYPKN